MRRIAVQMDPIETMVVDRDTSLALMVEAQARGMELWWFAPPDLYWDRGQVAAMAHRVSVRFEPGNHYTTHESRALDLATCDAVLIRQDPPFDMGYVSTTYLLEQLSHKTLVLNDPRGVRDIPEKLSTLNFPDLIAATFVGRNIAAIKAFAGAFEKVVLKPAFFAGGEGVLMGALKDADFETKVSTMLASVGKEPIIVQEFLPRVSEGDKRLFVLDGQAIGVVRRMPKAGDFRANLHVGGVAVSGDVDARDREIAAAVAPLLAECGVLFAGLDVIDGRLTEINVTSPTLIQQLKQFSGVDAAKLYWDAVEKRWD